jgi:hypothetical protein
MRKTVALCIASLLLASCVGIDSRLTIRDNGSGALALTYRISQLVADLGASSTGKGAIPLPVERADFERSLEGAKGKVKLTKFERSENENDITIRAELSFDSVAALAQVDTFKDMNLTLVAEGSRRTLTQRLVKAPTEPVAEDSLRMIDALFEGYELSFRIETPQPIASSNVGSLSADKRALTWSTSVKDLMRLKDDVVLTLGW